MYTKECAICKNTFECRNKMTVVCGSECRKERARLWKKERQIQKKREGAEKRTQEVKEREQALNEKIRKARELGLSYGHYVAITEGRICKSL